jgi:hypothetical protein
MRYELLYDGGGEAEKRLCGLIDPEELDNDAKKLGLQGQKFGSSWPQVGGVLGSENVAQSRAVAGVEAKVVEVRPNAVIRRSKKSSSLAAVVQA